MKITTYNYWRDNKPFKEDAFFPILAITYNENKIWCAVLGFGLGVSF